MRKSVLLQVAVSLAIIAIVLYLSDFGKVLETLSSINPPYMLIAIMFYVFINVCMAYRVRLVLRELKKEISMREMVYANFAGMLASDFTPARSGYLATAFVISTDEKIPLEKSMVSILGPQIFDFSLKVVVGATAFWYLMSYIVTPGEQGGIKVAGMLIGVFILLSMVVFIILLLFSKSFIRRISFLKRLPYGEGIYMTLLEMQKSSKAVKNLVPQLTLLLFVTWAAKAFEWLFVAQSIGLKLDTQMPALVFFAFLQPLVTILQFIPTPTLAGMGLSEGGAAVVLSLFGVPYYEGVAFSLLTRGMNAFADLLGIRGVLKVLKKHYYKLD